MKWIPYRYRPSFGFLLVVFSLLALGLFFRWGLSEPDLDKVWRIQHRLRQGEAVVVTGGERNAVERCLLRHPELELAVEADGRVVRVDRIDATVEPGEDPEDEGEEADEEGGE